MCVTIHVCADRGDTLELVAPSSARLSSKYVHLYDCYWLTAQIVCAARCVSVAISIVTSTTRLLEKRDDRDDVRAQTSATQDGRRTIASVSTTNTSLDGSEAGSLEGKDKAKSALGV